MKVKSIFLFLCSLVMVGAAQEQNAKITSIPEAVNWLEKTTHSLIRDSRREMPNGMSAFPPQVGIGYEAFWLRDYEYMLEGGIEAFTENELKDACRFFVKGISAEGAGVDCIRFDGTPVYKPGMGTMGENPVADGSPFTVEVAWQTYQKTRNLELLNEIIEPLIRTLRACPRDPKNGLVFIDPGKDYDRCPYGFTDTVRKKGDELFCSLLFVQAARHLASMLDDLKRASEARDWRKEADQCTGQIRETFWDDDAGLFRAATVQCREPDLWGSVFAVYTGVATKEQSDRIAQYFPQHYSEIIQKGQLRHTPGGTYWEAARERDQYQNGGYWATPMGWVIYTLNRIDPALADRTILELINALREQGVPEWFFGAHIQLPGYVASAALPLAGIRRVMEERKLR